MTGGPMKAPLKKSALILAWLVCKSPISMANQDPPLFPYSFTQETLSKNDVPLGARAEGRIEEMSFKDKAAYALKYLNRPKYSSGIEILDHMQSQRALILASRRNKAHFSESNPAVRVALVGDIMWIRNGWDTFLPEETKNYFDQLDAMLGNLETPIAKSFKVPSLLPDAFAFNAPPGLLQTLKRSDGRHYFAALSFANNHTLDMGDQGAVETLEFLKNEGVPQSGARVDLEEKSYASFARGGITFGLYAATFGVNERKKLQNTKLFINVVPGLAPNPSEGQQHMADLEQVRAALTEMTREGIDVKIVSLHWGHEFEFYPTAFQMQVAREIVAAGADVILGGHSHVQQPLEICMVNDPESRPGVGTCSVSDPHNPRLRKALVIYSLGNFLTNMFTPRSKLGAVQELFFHKSTDGSIDWTLGSTEFVLNYTGGRSTQGQRKLFLMSELLKDAKKNRTFLTRPVLEHHSFLLRHMGVVPGDSPN